MRCADDAHVNRFFLGGTKGSHAAFLDGPQQLGLHRQGQITNFVEKQRTAARRLKVSVAVLCGAGIRTFAGTEKLGFEQVFRNGTTVDRDQRPIGPLAARLYRLCDEFFTRTRFTSNQHWSHAA